jgi:hypothetical protein
MSHFLLSFNQHPWQAVDRGRLPRFLGQNIRQGEAGRRPPLSCITGHTLKDAILDAHYLGGVVELAEAAIVKLNAVYG